MKDLYACEPSNSCRKSADGSSLRCFISCNRASGMGPCSSKYWVKCMIFTDAARSGCIRLHLQSNNILEGSSCIGNDESNKNISSEKLMHICLCYECLVMFDCIQKFQFNRFYLFYTEPLCLLRKLLMYRAGCSKWYNELWPRILSSYQLYISYNWTYLLKCFPSKTPFKDTGANTPASVNNSRPPDPSK